MVGVRMRCQQRKLCLPQKLKINGSLHSYFYRYGCLFAFANNNERERMNYEYPNRIRNFPQETSSRLRERFSAFIKRMHQGRRAWSKEFKDAIDVLLRGRRSKQKCIHWTSFSSPSARICPNENTSAHCARLSFRQMQYARRNKQTEEEKPSEMQINWQKLMGKIYASTAINLSSNKAKQINILFGSYLMRSQVKYIRRHAACDRWKHPNASCSRTGFD